jgi:hypothetical protein
VHGRNLRGHAEIREALDARSGPEVTVRHLVTSQQFHSIEGTVAQGVVSLFAYAGPTPVDEGPAHYPSANAGHIVELNDHYRFDNGH